MTDARRCANCKAPLPPEWPSDNHYCAKCNAAWQHGQTAQDRATSAEKN